MVESSISLLTIIGCILIILKTFNLITLSWFYVLLPTIILLVLGVIGLIVGIIIIITNYTTK